jgi:hypothetical protein
MCSALKTNRAAIGRRIAILLPEGYRAADYEFQKESPMTRPISVGLSVMKYLVKPFSADANCIIAEFKPRTRTIEFDATADSIPVEAWETPTMAIHRVFPQALII